MLAAPAAKAAIKSGDHLILVDGSAFIFRAFHALPPLTRKSDGLPVGAVAGFCNMIWKLMQEGPTAAPGAQDSYSGPTHFAVIFDYSAKTFRNELYADYKAHRPTPPSDLIPQFGLIRQATRAFNLACIEQQGWEADDIIATYAAQARKAGATVAIVSSDKDLMQIVGDGVTMVDTMRDQVIDRDAVFAKFGVWPEKMIDLQALCGDSTDNVPGVPGIGPKTAAQLLDEYGDLETLLARAGEIRQPKRRDNLLQFAEQARISRKLVELCCEVPLDTPLGDLAVEAVDGARAVGFCKALEFNSLTRRVAEKTGADAGAVEPAELTIEGWPPETGAAAHGPDLPEAGPGAESGAGSGPERRARRAAGPPGPEELKAKPAAPAEPIDGLGAPARLVEARKKSACLPKIELDTYPIVRSLAELSRWISEAEAAGVVAVATVTDSLDPMQAKLRGISLAIRPGHACHIPLADAADAFEQRDDLFGSVHPSPGRLRDSTSPSGGEVSSAAAASFTSPPEGEVESGRSPEPGEGSPAPSNAQIPFADALAALKPLLENPAVLKIGQNVKFDWLLLRQRGIETAPFDDTMLMSYALDAGARSGHGMAGLCKDILEYEPLVVKRSVERPDGHAAEDSDVTLRLWTVLKPRLAAERVASVYERLERPLVPVLARMERRGVKVDRQILSRLSGKFAQKAEAAEAEIFDMAGQRFNIGSTKQLGEILYGQMGLAGGKKTKTGAWSTDVKVLDDLAAEGVPIARKIVEWRQLTKLKSTYTDALPAYINRETGRVHTSYSLASTSTGRLSSVEPNLQNIPIRTEEGRAIRAAFIAEDGWTLVSADYSQIELRVLAHVAEIPQLRRAFADGLDIHAMTASEMFSTPIEGMDPNVRRRAKAINFGIIYGISGFGLAQQLSIPQSEARDYIARYFERFPGIRGYMDDTKRFAREHLYVETLFGRRAHYPDIRSSQPALRANQERAAINAPIQGSAADIIRRAMIRMDDALAEAGLRARMLLQVHDELVFEVPDEEVADSLPVIKRVMEGAAEPAVALRVPLQVDARAAHNWDEAH